MWILNLNHLKLLFNNESGCVESTEKGSEAKIDPTTLSHNLFGDNHNDDNIKHLQWWWWSEHSPHRCLYPHQQWWQKQREKQCWQNTIINNLAFSCLIISKKRDADNNFVIWVTFPYLMQWWGQDRLVHLKLMLLAQSMKGLPNHPSSQVLSNMCQTAVRRIATAPNESLRQGDAETRNDNEVDRISQILHKFWGGLLLQTWVLSC